MSFNQHYNIKKYTKISKFRKNTILSFIDKKEALILDIGCSDGGLGQFLQKEKSAIVYGLDISDVAIKEARNKLAEAFVFNIEDNKNSLPEIVQSKKFDYIVISEVLEHLLYPEKVLENIKDLMHENTKIIITVPNILFWKNRLKIFFGNFDYQEEGLMDRGHIHFFTWKSLNSVVKNTNYCVVGVNNNIPTRFTRVFGKFFPGIFAYQFCICIKNK